MPYALTELPTQLYRFGRQPDPFRWWPPRAPLPDDDAPGAATAGGRFDDELGSFETLYVADAPWMALTEGLQEFRPRPQVNDQLDAIDGPTDPDAITAASGVLPRSVLTPSTDAGRRRMRVLGTCTSLAGQLVVDLADRATHLTLDEQLAHALAELGVDRFDRGVMMNQDRRITRRLASHIREAVDDSIVGVRYESRYASKASCYALWSHVQLHDFQSLPTTTASPDLQRAAELLGITLPA